MPEIIFTAHAEFRIKKRGLSREDVSQVVTAPDVTLKKHGKVYFQKTLGRGKTEVVCESTTDGLKVITVYWL